MELDFKLDSLQVWVGSQCPQSLIPSSLQNCTGTCQPIITQIHTSQVFEGSGLWEALDTLLLL